LADCGTSFLGRTELVKRYRRGFPRSLNGAPLFLPTEETIIRHSIDEWLSAEGIRPEVRGEFLDFDMFELFGSAGHGLIALPTLIEADVCRKYELRRLGHVEAIRHRFYGITLEQKVKHPGVTAILGDSLRSNADGTSDG
jgi:LysR family transcriptional activator of nhaA